MWPWRRRHPGPDRTRVLMGYACSARDAKARRRALDALGRTGLTTEQAEVLLANVDRPPSTQ